MTAPSDARHARPERLGDAAWRWELAPSVDRRALLDALRALEGVVDAVVTERHACVIALPDAPLPDIASAMRAAGTTATAPREHVVRVRYDGPDLPAIAARAGIAPEEVALRHAGRVYVVSMVGFLPGFAYLRDVDPTISAPRRAPPRPRVARNAVGIAAGYTGIYPFASPGGWNLVGTALDVSPFDPERGATFALGDRVRFERAS